jgi:hypothetical protein
MTSYLSFFRLNAESAVVRDGCRLGWVDIGIGTKGKWGFLVSLKKLWEIAIKVSLINRPLSQRSLLLGSCST